MLLDDKQAMINDLLIAYRESNDHYRDAAEQLDGGTPAERELGELLASIRDSREGTIERLSELVRESGDLPREPDADKEEALQLFTRLKAALGGERRRIVLEERVTGEQRIAEQLEEALRLDFPADTLDWLRTLQERQSETLLRLNEALVSTRPEG